MLRRSENPNAREIILLRPRQPECRRGSETSTMRPILVMSLLLFLGIHTKAAEDGQAVYDGGTTDVKAGTIGKIAIRPEALNFEYSGGRLTIRFDRMESYEYSFFFLNNPAPPKSSPFPLLNPLPI